MAEKIEYIKREDAKAKIREEWVKYMPMDFDLELCFVLAKLHDVPIADVVEREEHNKIVEMLNIKIAELSKRQTNKMISGYITTSTDYKPIEYVERKRGKWVKDNGRKGSVTWW